MKFALIFAGCGFLDGTEIREAVLTLLELENNKIEYDIFAPNITQHHVINHINQSETGESRNVLIESARIARGKIQDITNLNPENYSALIFTGGFGVAKNFSKLAFNGSNSPVITEVKKVIVDFHNLKKPIGAICIAPAIVAMCLQDNNPKVTLGFESTLLADIGVKNISCKTQDIVFDQNNLIVSTPAYMHENESLPNIHAGIKKLITKLKEISQ